MPHYERRKTELSVLKGCLLWGDRVVIPPTLRKRILTVLHNGHPGMVKMKALARSYVWWPGLDKDIEAWVATCNPCQETRQAPPKARPTAWEAPSTPWARIHIDFAGPFHGQTFLIIVDAYSKWLEVTIMSSTTTEATIKALQKVFSTHGIPDILVSDNGPQFTAKDFEEFLADLGIRHALSAPAHPATNGQAEIMVKLTKATLKKMGPGDWQEKLNKFLLTQHVTPLTTTHRSPAELLMGRKLRTILDRVHPNYSAETPADSSSKVRLFKLGDLVYAKNYTGGPLWIPATITSITGPRSYKITLDDDREWNRHIDQLRSRRPPRTGEDTHPGEREMADPIGDEDGQEQTQPQGPAGNLPSSGDIPRSSSEASGSTVPAPPQACFQSLPAEGTGAAADLSAQAAASGTTELRRSSRETKSPAYLRDYVR